MNWLLFGTQTTESDIIMKSGYGPNQSHNWLILWASRRTNKGFLEEGALMPRALKQRWQKGGLSDENKYLKLIVCKLRPEISQTPPLQRETTQATYWADKHLPTWPGTLAGACSSIQLWLQTVPRIGQWCLPVYSCSLSPYQLKMNSTELSCQLKHEPFPCRAKACDSLQ